MAVISISRQYGAGGVSVGGMVASRLGYRMVDEAVLTEVAQQANISVQWVKEADRSAGDRLARLVPKILAHREFVRYLPGTTTKLDEKLYRQFLRIVIAKLGEEGRVVILGRGSQFILKDNPQAIRVMLRAEEKDRIASLEKRYGLSREKAAAVGQIAEKNRLNFLRGFKAGDPDDPQHYHLVINTSLVSHEKAADMICLLVE
jgi:cytidylate kinase